LIQSKSDLLQWTSNIVAAYLNKNEVDPRQIPHVLETVYAKLSALGGDVAEARAFLFDQPLSHLPTAPSTVVIEKSVTPDYLICLEDGVRLKTMKRYLFRKYRLTPEQYRMKWGLPADYPMVAPNYAAKRSNLAKSMGLGKSKKRTKRTGVGRSVRRG
jgi:predicted transcriptional regulator